MLREKVKKEIEKIKVLFLVKKNDAYGEYSEGYGGQPKSGLLNSARFVNDAINKFDFVESEIDDCVDGNEIDKRLTEHRPDICVIEAIWVTPAKFIELHKIHKRVQFIVRVHSKIPFLSMEGMAVDWIKQYELNDFITVSFNNEDTSNSFNNIDVQNEYLPNIYIDFEHESQITLTHKIKHILDINKYNISRGVFKVGCFGAIRPFKNQLSQAMAAIIFADRHDAVLEFYVNASRTEQNGGNVLKNLRALFKDTNHKLVEIPWMEHHNFLKILRDMDLCLQISYTESFNIVTADCVMMKVPVVVSPDINWIHTNVADPNDVEDIANKIEDALINQRIDIDKNLTSLFKYNKKAIKAWKEYLEKFRK